MIAPTQTSRPLVGSRFGLATQSPIALSCTHLKRSGLRIKPAPDSVRNISKGESLAEEVSQ